MVLNQCYIHGILPIFGKRNLDNRNVDNTLICSDRSLFHCSLSKSHLALIVAVTIDVTVAVLVIVARHLVSVTVARQFVSVATPMHSVCVAMHLCTVEAQEVIVVVADVATDVEVAAIVLLIDDGVDSEVDGEGARELDEVGLPLELNLYKSRTEAPPQYWVLSKSQGVLHVVAPGKALGFKVLPQ